MHWPWAIGDDPVKGCWVLSNRWELQRTSWGKQILLWWGSLVEAKSWLSLSQVFPCRQWKVKITYIARTKYGWMVELKSKVPFQPFPIFGKDSSRTMRLFAFPFKSCFDLRWCWSRMPTRQHPRLQSSSRSGESNYTQWIGMCRQTWNIIQRQQLGCNPPWLLFPDVIRLRLEFCLKSDTEPRS